MKLLLLSSYLKNEYENDFLFYYFNCAQNTFSPFLICRCIFVHKKLSLTVTERCSQGRINNEPALVQIKPKSQTSDKLSSEPMIA